MKTAPESVIILADIEGITGVYEAAQCKPMTPEWKKARHLITADISAAITGLKDAGIRNIFVRDLHLTGFNILPDLLPHEGVSLIQGQYWYPVPLLGRIPEADLALMIGWHAGPDQSDGFSPHIFHRDVDWVRINEKLVTEVEIFAMVLSESGIPVGLVTADHTACIRILGNMPWVHLVEVPKTNLTPKERAKIQRTIREESEKAVQQAGTFECFPKGPYELESSMRGYLRKKSYLSAQEMLRDLLRQSVLKWVPEIMIPSILQGQRVMGFWQQLWGFSG